ncbi:cytosolic endo-beta-N-acetylglucosaminidase [Strongylocentrotus purpuratus]|uniref:Cytosolic endo-beta-N-acetylglucosaminidase n=1 Tax=Strongylocentrotus purpuratus TaxID=7668 RepID=A0A7M7P7U4_STRPU|nr:cytosolic endo-beta-N-acetylglucosaminidase-like [Strongylocentrotus purpuratus]XP_030847363.1 cytosolic endo-beta-N-acetylglucosaminidase [Strongylocentrotus purpuratus]|eukprot:XP_011661837.1 PREDICTED: cytosolic endo-beta-N-acetylglucosaminidase isoform X1 [Strongylocentrotus purpuratus]
MSSQGEQKDLAAEFMSKVKITDYPDLGNRFEPKTSEPITRPLDSLDEVLLWQPDDQFNVANSPLATPTTPAEPRPMTLVCHDMKGGYIDDRFVQGVPISSAYRFYHWQYIDIFIYFSHHFVTIPPPCWTDAAHKNGTLMLGTVITEWQDGKKRCAEMYGSEAACKRFADKLVEIAKYYNFEGWLINIENPIPPEHMPQLLFFVQYLTKQMHQHIEGSKVIWYDSVIADGSLRWQDMLNDNNRIFFDASDAIFLNYTWNENKLASSVQNAGPRKHDVYVGVDIFGRNCFGGGGWNTNKAMEVIKRQGLSTAIFAPGWVMEKLGEADFVANQDKFWSLLDSYLYTHGVSSLPFVTNFCRGYGEFGFKCGNEVMKKAWCNLSSQQIVPTYGKEQFSDVEGASKKTVMQYVVSDAFNGGGCVEIHGGLAASQVTRCKLFATGISGSHPLLVSYTAKHGDNCKMCLYLSTPNKEILLWNTADDMKAGEQPMSTYGLRLSALVDHSTVPDSLKSSDPTIFSPLVGTCHKILQDASFGIDSSVVPTQGWVTRNYLVPESVLTAGAKITEIGLLCFSAAPVESYSVKIGEIKVVDPGSLRDQTQQVTDLSCQDVTWHPPIANVVDPHTVVSLCATLTWSYPAGLGDHFDIYCSGIERDPNQSRAVSKSDKLFVGRAHSHSFRVCHLLIPKIENEGQEDCIEFCVQPTTRAGFSAPLLDVSSCKVVYSK